MHLLKDREMRRACISLLIFNMDMMLVNIPFHFLHFDGGHILSGFSFTCFLKKLSDFGITRHPSPWQMNNKHTSGGVHVHLHHVTFQPKQICSPNFLGIFVFGLYCFLLWGSCSSSKTSTILQVEISNGKGLGK